MICCCIHRWQIVCIEVERERKKRNKKKTTILTTTATICYITHGQRERRWWRGKGGSHDHRLPFVTSALLRNGVFLFCLYFCKKARNYCSLSVARRSSWYPRSSKWHAPTATNNASNCLSVSLSPLLLAYAFIPSPPRSGHTASTRLSRSRSPKPLSFRSLTLALKLSLHLRLELRLDCLAIIAPPRTSTWITASLRIPRRDHHNGETTE